MFEAPKALFKPQMFVDSSTTTQKAQSSQWKTEAI
jgi:hypothetical protein